MKSMLGQRRREVKHQLCDPFLQNALHPFRIFLCGFASLLIPRQFLTKLSWWVGQGLSAYIADILYSKHSA